MSHVKHVFCVLAGIAPLLGGCGLFVPEIEEPDQIPASEKFDENVLVNHIKCELHKGVQDALATDGKGEFSGNSVAWLRQWGANVTLLLTVDQKGGLAPGISFMEPFQNAIAHFPSGTVTTPQSFALGLGLQYSADATRKETIGFTYSFDDLMNEKPIVACDDQDGVLIHSDLKIGQFILNKAFIAKVPGSVSSGKPGSLKAGDKTITGAGKASPYTAFSYEATFVVVYGGNVTPTWKFARVSASSNSPFYAATRTRTQDVAITLGLFTPGGQEVSPGAVAPPSGQISAEAQAVHNANLIGQAVAAAIQSQAH